MILTFDIETLPTTYQFVIDKIAKSIRPPGNIKKKESIDAWMLENFESALKEKVKETALSGAYGRIACICWSIDDDPGIYGTHIHNDESECIKSFYDFIDGNGIDAFCGHNIAAFDLSFLRHRSIILGIKPPQVMLDAMAAKPWDNIVKDTQFLWTGDRNKYISLYELLNILNIEHDHTDFNGSMVANEWENGSKDKVISYCIADVVATRKAYKTMTFAPAVF